jgi:hypothetical protein
VVREFDAALARIVQWQWDELVRETAKTIPRAKTDAKVVVAFRLHSDGRVSELRVEETGGLDSVWTGACYYAIQKSAPFRPWSVEMGRQVGREYRALRLIFHYTP